MSRSSATTSYHPGNGCSGHVDITITYNNEIYNTIKKHHNNIKEIITVQLKATEPDAEAKGLQRRTTFKNGIIDGRNKKPSPPPDWATIRLGNAWHHNRRKKEVRNPPREH